MTIELPVLEFTMDFLDVTLMTKILGLFKGDLYVSTGKKVSGALNNVANLYPRLGTE